MPSVSALTQQIPSQGVQAGTRPVNRQVDEKEPDSGLTMDKFLHSLPTPRISDLPEGDLECSICRETYLEGPAAEKAARLPCGHHFGIDCIRQWLECGPNPRCPLCRIPLLQKEDRKDSDILEVSINLLEQLVVDPTSTTRVLADARRQTERRIAAARRHARRRRMSGDDNLNEIMPDGEIQEVTARQVLTRFKALINADLYTSQPLEYHQWKRLAKEIEEVRQRVISPLERTGTLWDERGPELVVLLNPVLRPLVEEFLEKMVQNQRCTGPIA